jgi:hypothetical protein
MYVLCDIEWLNSMLMTNLNICGRKLSWPILKYYLDTWMEGLRKIMTKLSHDSHSWGWDLILWPPRYGSVYVYVKRIVVYYRLIWQSINNVVSKHMTFDLYRFYAVHNCHCQCLYIFMWNSCIMSSEYVILCVCVCVCLCVCVCVCECMYVCRRFHDIDSEV